MGLLSGIGKLVGGITGGDILGVGGTLLGGALQNQGSASAASAANNFTREQLQNRHQWEVADLRAAGLNPIISAQGSPSIGSSAKAEVSNVVSPAVQAALQVNMQREQINNIKAQTAKTQAETNVISKGEPAGKFFKQAGDNALKALDKLPNIPDWLRSKFDSLKGSAKQIYNDGKPLRVTVRPSDARKNLGPPDPFNNYIPMPPKP